MKKRNGKLEFKIHITFLLAADETIIFTETRWKHHSIFRFRCVTLVIASLVHPYGAPETLPLQQEVKSLVDVLEANFMGYELVKLQLLDRGKSTGLLLQQNARSRCMHVGLFWIDAPLAGASPGIDLVYRLLRTLPGPWRFRRAKPKKPTETRTRTMLVMSEAVPCSCTCRREWGCPA